MSYYYKYDFVSPEPLYATVKEELKSYFDTGKYVSDELVNLDKNKVKAKSNSRQIEEKVKINYFANRLIRKS